MTDFTPLVATFDGAAPPGTINFGIGQPSADLLPVDLLRDASLAFLDSAQNIELNYGVPQGDERFRHSLAGFLSCEYDADVNPDSLLVSAGNSQAIDLVATVFANAGDTVFVEEPSYFLAFQIFRDHGLNIVSIPVDENGLKIEYLMQQLALHKPAFLYTIPTFHNPGGQSLSHSRRLELLRLSVEHDFLIVADEVYHSLSYEGVPPPAFGTHIEYGSVVSLGSFSKILAPALRLGWIQTAPRQIQRLLSSGQINSGGSLNHYTSHIVRLAIDLGLQEKHLTTLREEYGRRAVAMNAALEKFFSKDAQWLRPTGGYFFWLRFRADIDTAKFRDAASDAETGFQAGQNFSNAGALRNCLRLSFAHYDEFDIARGIKRLRGVFDA